MRSGFAFLTVVAVLALAVPSAAARPPDTARIVEHVSAGGVKLGASRSSVTRAWGSANECVTVLKSWASNPGVVQCTWGARGQRPGQLEVEFLRSKAVAIHVRLIPFVDGRFPGWKTTKGIALAATPAAVQAAYGAAQLRRAAGDRAYGWHYYLSKQDGESVVETRFSFPQDYDRDQTLRQIALYDLDVRDICGTVDGPHWKTRRSSSPSEGGTRFLVYRTAGFARPGVKCAFARSWVTKLLGQRPRKLYPTSSSSNFLAGPARPKKYICSGQTGGRGSNQNPVYLKTGPWPILGGCSPQSGQGFSWAPDRTTDHDNDGE